jgi:DNA-binding NtrC family response regulator
LLVRHFLTGLKRDKPERAFSDESMRRLEAYQWPGNVRELRHVVQRSLIMSDPGSMELELPAHFESPFAGGAAQQGLEAGRTISDVERELIELTLAHFDGDKKAASETLGISLNTLYNRLNAYRETESS